MKHNQYYRPINRNHMKKPVPAWHIVLVIGVAIVIILASAASKACDEVYLKVGASYKFVETDEIKMRDGSTAKMDIHSPIGARIELGVEKGRWSYGISHHSQYFTGYPINDKKEYSKTEFFIDRKFELWRL